jgi:NAD(P)-dependent dehydrogenase (short-subunit alcohol dehydrogenase family)
MKVVLADVEKSALDETVAELQREGAAVTGIVTDVSQQEALFALADDVYASHGAVHVLCNNAGIGTDETRSRIWDSPANDWTWAFRVNVWGVLHGIKAFVPRMLSGGQDGHVVNTSSANGGLYPLPTTPIYATTKAAVTTITEVLHHQLRAARAKIRASVLFPGPYIVATNIFDAARNRPLDLPNERPDAPPPPTLEDIRRMTEQAGGKFVATQPNNVALYTLEALRQDRFWILPRGRSDEAIRARLESIISRADPPSS